MPFVAKFLTFFLVLRDAANVIFTTDNDVVSSYNAKTKRSTVPRISKFPLVYVDSFQRTAINVNSWIKVWDVSNEMSIRWLLGFYVCNLLLELGCL